MLLISVIYRLAVKTLDEESKLIMLFIHFIDRRVEIRRTRYIVLINDLEVLFSEELLTHFLSSKSSLLD